MIINTKIIEKLNICEGGYTAALLSGYEHDTDIELDDLCSIMESSGHGYHIGELKEIIDNKRYIFEEYTVTKYFVFDGTAGHHNEFETLEDAKNGQKELIHEKIISLLENMIIKEECTFSDGTTQLKILDENLPEYTLEFVESVISSIE